MFVDDLSEFFDPDDFATPATFSGTGATVNVILDAEYAEPFDRVQSAKPQAIARLVDVPGAAQGMTLTLLEATPRYPAGTVLVLVDGGQPDGLGMTVLNLRKA